MSVFGRYCRDLLKLLGSFPSGAGLVSVSVQARIHKAPKEGNQ